MRESFVLFTEYAEHMKLLNMEQRGVLLTAIMNYETDIELPEMDDCVAMAFSFIKANLDRTDQKYETTKAARSAAGQASGEARRNKSEQTRTNTNKSEQNEQTGTKRNKTNNNVNVNVNDNVFKEKEVKEKEKLSPAVREELDAFVEHRKKLRKPMTDHAIDLLVTKLLKLAATDEERVEMLREAIEKGWQTVYKHEARGKPPNRFNSFQQRKYDEDDLEQQLLFGG